MCYMRRNECPIDGAWMKGVRLYAEANRENITKKTGTLNMFVLMGVCVGGQILIRVPDNRRRPNITMRVDGVAMDMFLCVLNGQESRSVMW